MFAQKTQLYLDKEMLYKTGIELFDKKQYTAAQKTFIDYMAAASGGVSIKVFNALGQSMYSKKAAVEKGKQLLWIDVSGYSDGIFVIQIQDDITGNVLQSKFMKE